MLGVLRRAWMPLLIVAVAVAGVFVVHRVRGYFGDRGHVDASDAFQDTEPFNPKVVTYDIFGVDGAVTDINYLDLNSQPQRLDGATLPWSLTLSTTDPAVSPNIVAQGQGNTIGCRITIDDVVKDEKISNGVNAETFCLVKSG